ncbi:hypothetical protein HC752_16170 [Vibrio sp. S9_S30]|uniref:capsular polysaccharide export protein, LipB/KpsS family n=1 Tax=Vibrio sp. S9_S30 TaxID=2720226 RepID=UPI00168105A4|nr:hypothetical protein [Vibrio sp. S9_S30]MBD1558472.1 hypothetical protein [Vibrio sp. S9_S30]
MNKDKISNKRVLLICRERSSYPLFFLAKQLKAQGNEVALFFVSSFEGFYNESRHNRTTYYYAKKNFNTVYDLNNATDTFINRNSKFQEKIDTDLLRDIDSYYPIRKQFLFEQNLCAEFHARFQNNEISDDEKLYWLELVYRDTQSVIENFRPEIILDLENVTITRVAIKYYAEKAHVKYIGLNYPRYKDYLIPSFNLSIENDTYFENMYQSMLNNESVRSDYLETYRNKSGILPEKFKNSITDTKYDWLHGLKMIVGSALREYDIEIRSGNLSKKSYKIGLPLFENPFKKVWFHVCYEYKRYLALTGKNKYFESPVPSERYIYYPLHLIPESTTFVQAPMFIDELSVIRNISKSLPYDVKLYVKEHPAMSGERPSEFYRELRKLTNVRIIRLDHYKDPKPMIENSKGVITIAGSSALEAIMLKRPALIFGNVPYSVIPNITKCTSMDDLSQCISEMLDATWCEKTDNNISNYFELVESVGTQVKLADLILSTESSIVHNKALAGEAQVQLEQLMLFFEKGIELHD